MTPAEPSQASLFELAEVPLEAAPVKPEYAELAARLGTVTRFGTMSWNYPGWRGHVYGEKVDVKELAERGLLPYAQHPLLTSVEIDRTYYGPLPASALQAFARQVPAAFRFIVKANEACVLRQFPLHARYGKKRGEANSLYLDAAYASEVVVAPAREGLGEKLGAVLFQFPPQDVGGARAFAEKLRTFLLGLPRGIVYAVELRNRELLGTAYAEALTASGAVHCHNVWGEMPSVLEQARRIPPIARNPLIVRWLMRQGDDYQSAGARYLPFDRLADEDIPNRGSIARLVSRASAHGVPSFLLLDNKAEGCAPESIVRLARVIAQELQSLPSSR